MKERVFQNDENSFEVSDRNSCVEFNVNIDKSITIRSAEEAGWDSQITYFILTEQEAKQLTEFLVKKGY